MTDLTIHYPNGEMTFHVQKFFPCKAADAVKAFRLINAWITEADFNELWDALSEMYSHYDREAKKYQVLADGEKSAGNKGKEREFLSLYNRNEALRKRCRRNIELLIGGYRL